MCLNDIPDEIKIHTVEQCTECGAYPKDIFTERYIVRQIIDIPDIKVKVVEHGSEVKICPHCKSKNTASFPEKIKNTIQYGERLKAIAVYLTQYQLIPYKRGVELIEDLFNIHLSQGSMVTFNQSCHDKLEAITNKIRNCLTSSVFYN